MRNRPNLLQMVLAAGLTVQCVNDVNDGEVFRASEVGVKGVGLIRSEESNSVKNAKEEGEFEEAEKEQELERIKEEVLNCVSDLAHEDGRTLMCDDRFWNCILTENEDGDTAESTENDDPKAKIGVGFRWSSDGGSDAITIKISPDIEPVIMLDAAMFITSSPEFFNKNFPHDSVANTCRAYFNALESAPTVKSFFPQLPSEAAFEKRIIDVGVAQGEVLINDENRDQMKGNFGKWLLQWNSIGENPERFVETYSTER